MADLAPPGDGIPTWLTALLSVAGTVASIPAVKPALRWVGRRLDVMQEMRAAERGDFLSQTLKELQAAREEMVQIRQELAEEKELRMAVVVENAELRRDVEHLTRAIAEDKKDCQEQIAALRREIRDLRRPPGRRPDAP